MTYQTFHVTKTKEAKPKKGEIYPLCVALAGSLLADDDDDFKSEFEDDYDMAGGGEDDEFGGSFEGEEDFAGGDDDFSFESDNFDNIDDHDL